MKPSPRGAALPQLVIFDCDGVLVDSEVISAQVLSDTLCAAGVKVDVDFVYRRFLGRSIEAVREVLLGDFSHELSDDTLAAMRAAMERRLRSELNPIRGIAEALTRVPARKCVASSSRPERIRLSLAKTSLLEFFEPHIFSATMVPNGKPAPDLFLHAARQMDVKPHQCVVIEDSPAGVQAARAAGMRVLAFTGGGHAKPARLKSSLAALKPDAIFSDMLRLPELLAEEPA